MGRTGYTCIRRTFCWLNLIVWLCGSVFLAAGIWLKLCYQGYATLLPEHAALSADCLFITVGVLSVVVSFFGCCGAWFQSRCLLISYFSLVVILFLSEFLVGSLAFVFRGGLTKTVFIGNTTRYLSRDLPWNFEEFIDDIGEALEAINNLPANGIEFIPRIPIFVLFANIVYNWLSIAVRSADPPKPPLPPPKSFPPNGAATAPLVATKIALITTPRYILSGLLHFTKCLEAQNHRKTPMVANLWRLFEVWYYINTTLPTQMHHQPARMSTLFGTMWLIFVQQTDQE
uniref:Putative tetraspanin 5d isoform a n=1 Tax=Lutzomyia longipalpis TaxID=7200 RepID=A0A1B0CR27_LUTLO